MILELEQIVQIITILVFLGSSVAFFIKLGELKTGTIKDIKQLQHDIVILQEEHKETAKELENIKQHNTQSILELKTLLMEVKTKMELLIQLSGLFKNNENIKE